MMIGHHIGEFTFTPGLHFSVAMDPHWRHHVCMCVWMQVIVGMSLKRDTTARRTIWNSIKSLSMWMKVGEPWVCTLAKENKVTN